MNLDWLKNSWMNDKNFLAQAGHVLAMYGMMLTLHRFHVSQWWGIGGAIVYSVLKEWVYDTFFERPKQTWKDNLLDQVFLLFGMGLGRLVVW